MTYDHYERITASLGYDAAIALARDEVEQSRIRVADLSSEIQRRKRTWWPWYAVVFLAAMTFTVWIFGVAMP